MPVVSIFTTDPQIWSRLAGLLPATEEMLRSALRSCEKKRARLPIEAPLPPPPPRRSLWQRLIRWICLKD